MQIRSSIGRVVVCLVTALCIALGAYISRGQTDSSQPQADPALAQLDTRFTATIKPFLQTNCFSCHGQDKPEAGFDLTTYTSLASVMNDSHHALLLLQRLKGHEMPPKDAPEQPSADARQQAIDWFQ
jgi:mono/diheme cytochrome c family protein